MRRIASAPEPLAVLAAWRGEPGLSSFLALQSADHPESQFISGGGTLEPVPGGFSGSRVWKLVAPDERSWSLKCWPVDGPDEARLLRIAGLLRQAADAGCREWIACPCLTTEDRRPFARHADQLWQFQPWLPGLTLGANEFALSVFSAVVGHVIELHQCWNPPGQTASKLRTDVPQSVGQRLDGLAAVPGRVAAILRSASEPGESPAGFQLESVDPGLAVNACHVAKRLAPQLIEQGRRLLRPAWIVQPVLTDLWRENLLFRGGQLSGIIDYGSLREDLIEAVWARFLGSLDLEHARGWDDAAASGGSQMVAWSLIQSACAGRIEGNRNSAEIVGFLDAAGTVLGCLQWIDPLSVQNRVVATSPAARNRAVELMHKTISLAARF